MELATQLVDNGVDVILDKWNLREGNDAYSFMESMVTDPRVDKVIIVSDQRYAEKADSRKGGVGTESQIISPEIYKQADQSKFTAIVSEVDENGEPYLPKFLGARVFIDMTPSRYGTNFEQLLRWLYNKPLFVKPPLGKMPEFLKHDSTLSPTRAKARRTIDVISRSTANSEVSTNDYLGTLADLFESLRVAPNTPDFPQAVIDSVDNFLPYRNEFIEFILAATNASNPDLPRSLQRFFERIIPYMSRPASVVSYREWDFDNYVFIVHELFLYTVAALLRRERFETLTELLDQRFYVQDDNRDEPMKPFSVVRKHMATLVSKQQEMRRISLRADLLEQRSHIASELKFTDLMTADFVLFLRSAVLEVDYRAWYPETLLYATFRFRGPFEIFARSESRAYFQRISPVIGIQSKEELNALIATYSIDGKAGRWLPYWNYETLDIGRLANAAKLQSRP